MPIVSVPLRDPSGLQPLILLSGPNGEYEGVLPFNNLDYIMDTLERYPYQLLNNINPLRNALRRSMAAHRRHMNTDLRETFPHVGDVMQIGPSSRQYYLHRLALRHPIFMLD